MWRKRKVAMNKYRKSMYNSNDSELKCTGKLSSSYWNTRQGKHNIKMIPPTNVSNLNMLMPSVRIIHFLFSCCFRRNIEANNLQIPQFKWAKLPSLQFVKFDFKKWMSNFQEPVRVRVLEENWYKFANNM